MYLYFSVANGLTCLVTLFKALFVVSVEFLWHVTITKEIISAVTYGEAGLHEWDFLEVKTIYLHFYLYCEGTT